MKKRAGEVGYCTRFFTLPRALLCGYTGLYDKRLAHCGARDMGGTLTISRFPEQVGYDHTRHIGSLDRSAYVFTAQGLRALCGAYEKAASRVSNSITEPAVHGKYAPHSPFAAD